MKMIRKELRRIAVVVMCSLLLSACGDPYIDGSQALSGDGATVTPAQEEEVSRNIEPTAEPVATPVPTNMPTPTEIITPSATPTPTPTSTPTPEPTPALPNIVATDLDWDFSSLPVAEAREGKKGAFSYAYLDEKGVLEYYIFDFDKQKAFVFSEGNECTVLSYVCGNLVMGADYFLYSEEGPLLLKAQSTNPNYIKEIDVVRVDGKNVHLNKTNYEEAVALMDAGEIVDRSMPTPTPTPILVSEIRLSLKSVDLEVGDKVTVKTEILPKNAVDKTLVWYSDNADVATVDQKGTVTAVGRGTATITAVAHGSAASSISIKVENYKNRRMRVVATQRQVNDVNIGHEWYFEKTVNGQYTGDEMLVSAGDTLKFYCKFTEDDSVPDVGTASKAYKVTKSDILNGFEVTMEVKVTENRGKNAGKTAKFTVYFTFTLLDE